MSATALPTVPANMRHFSRTRPDLRERKSMVDFLTGHFRYDTMGSWNRSTAYANCVKVPRLGLTSEQETRVYDLLSADEGMSFLEERIAEFTAQQGGAYTVGSNGRSGGYLVMYNSHRKPSEHKSRCTHCGQLNFREIVDLAKLPEHEQAIAREVLTHRNRAMPREHLEAPAVQALPLPDNEKARLVRAWSERARFAGLEKTCGVCRKETRVPYSGSVLDIYSGKGIDMGEDFVEWSMSQLVERCRLVMAFDEMCDLIRMDLLDIVDAYEVVTETVMVPKQVRVLRERAS